MKKVKEKERKMNLSLIVDGSNQHVNQRFVSTRSQIWPKRVEISVNCETAGAALNTTPLPRSRLRGFVLSGEVCDTWFIGHVIVLFGYGIGVFVDLNNECVNEIILNENVEFEFEIEFENVNCDFYDCDDLCHVHKYPTRTACPTPIDFNGTDIGLCNNSILEFIFNVDCNVNGFLCGKDNNKNFYDNEYDYGVLLPLPTPATPNDFTRTDKELSGINVLESIFDIGLCDLKLSLENKLMNS